MSKKKNTHKRQDGIHEIWRRLKKNKMAMISLFVLLAMFILAILAPLLAPYEYEAQDKKHALEGTTAEHLLGTDRLGRDILSRLLYGARYSLEMGIISTGIASIIGIILGAIAGYYGGKVDNFVMRFLDIYQGIPMMLLCVTLAAVLGASLKNAIIALGISFVPGTARLMRASILTVRDKEYIEAAKSVNASTFRIIAKHIIPNAIAPVIVSITMSIGTCIMSGSMLSFIGLGAQAPLPEWGAMISDARNYMRGNPTLALYPGVCIMIAVLAFNLLGDGRRDAMDPRLKN
jgi:peptide/nickel transport system permease protein